MKLEKLRQIISSCYSDVIFTYNGLKSGITSEVTDSVPTFQVWHGNTTKEYSNVDVLMFDKFFSGKSLIDLIRVVEFELI